MKHFVRVVLVYLVLSASSASAAPIGIRAGGGFMIHPSRPGGHFSMEVPISQDYPTTVGAMFEMYSKGGTRVMPLGVTLGYKARLTDYGGAIFFEAGGGMLLTRGNTQNTDGMITTAGGLSVNLKGLWGVFGMVRWFRAFGNLSARNEFSFMFGLQFGIGTQDN